LIGNSHRHPFAEYYLPTHHCSAVLLYLDNKNKLNVDNLQENKVTCVKNISHQIVVWGSLLHLFIEATEKYLKKTTVPLDYSLYQRAKKEGKIDI
jgi:hypothetical protein